MGQTSVAGYKIPHFHIEFTGEIGNDYHILAETKIPRDMYTPSLRLEMLELLKKYRAAIDCMEVKSRYFHLNEMNMYNKGEDEEILGLPPGQFVADK